MTRPTKIENKDYLKLIKTVNINKDAMYYITKVFTTVFPTISETQALVVVMEYKRLQLKDQYGPRTFFLEFPFFAKNMIIKSILNLWWHSKILKLFLGVVRGIFTKRLKRTRRLLYTVKYDFFQMTALHSKC